MNRNWVYYILLLIVLLLIIIAIILYLVTIYVPGLLIRWHKGKDWITNEKLETKIFSKHEIENYLETINKMKVRKINGTLGTIGTASYIDGDDEYCEKAYRTNKILFENFPGLHNKLLSHLNNIMPDNLPCEYPPTKHNIAVPGFHIFEGNSLLGRGWPVASVHVDKQEDRVKWPKNSKLDKTRTYSFTIPISVPKGTGLYIMQKQEQDINMSFPLWWNLRNALMQKIEYKNGNCYLHHGKWFHMIAPFKAKKINGKYDKRITIQGHMIYNIEKKVYWVYW